MQKVLLPKCYMQLTYINNKSTGFCRNLPIYVVELLNTTDAL